MQLLQKNTRYLLTWLPVVLLLCSALFFVVLEMHAHHMQEKQLLLKQADTWNAFKEASGNIEMQMKGEYDIREGISAGNIALNKPRDTLINYDYEGKKTVLPFSVLTRSFQFNNKQYLVSTYVSSTEVSHLVIKVFATEGVILLFLLFAIVFLNRRSSKHLWSPFFSTMEQVREYEITRNQPLQLPAETGTTEFNELNKTITDMVNRVNTAYNNQRQFVENASHEIQTPLAIIRSKLELLINQPDLTEKNASLLNDITEANNRLSQMNRTLLLLAKIENNQFPEMETIDLSLALTKMIEDFKNHQENAPPITTSIAGDLFITANRSLMDILLSNLIKNSIIHNRPEGKINISLSPEELVIENTGFPLEINPEEVFERFKKGSHKTKTTGLGLSLVKQICNLYKYPVSYTYNNGWHKIKVGFEKQE
ncbi:MAG: HAMP domain-containing histidine kinase [Bacteroidetes bacterium]|nr:HAMP domain-containing histidine kinase [Bacteroidota bacterium]